MAQRAVAVDILDIDTVVAAAGILPSDTKLIRVRGPLINSNLGVGTYTVYVRPFYDEANNIGSLTLTAPSASPRNARVASSRLPSALVLRGYQRSVEFAIST